MRELDVLHHSGAFVPLGHAWVGSCQDGGPGIKGADDTSLGYGEGLLLL